MIGLPNAKTLDQISSLSSFVSIFHFFITFFVTFFHLRVKGPKQLPTAAASCFGPPTPPRKRRLGGPFFHNLPKELITFTRSDFLKNEINQAFFIWNQNEFYTKDFSDISPEDSRYSLFLDWFIYDYVIISTKKSLAEMYWEDNKEKIDRKILTTYRSIYKFKKLEDNIYLIEDIIQNMQHKIKINTEIPIDSGLLSLRIVPNDDFVSNISHIVAYNKQYKDIVYNSITNIITKNNKFLIKGFNNF